MLLKYIFTSKTFFFTFFVHTWFEARHVSSPWCYLLFILVPVSWKKSVPQSRFFFTTTIMLQNVWQNSERTGKDIENVDNRERRINARENVSGLRRKDVCKHWNVFHVDFNDLALISFLHIIWCAFFFTSLQFNCFFKEFVSYHIIHRVGNLRSIGMECWVLNIF